MSETQNEFDQILKAHSVLAFKGEIEEVTAKPENKLSCEI